MSDLARLGRVLQDILRLETKIIAYRRLEQAGDLHKIRNVSRIDHFFTFCQVPFMVRVGGLTVGVTKDDPMLPRCMRICGLKERTEKSMHREATDLATTWFCSYEDALRQQAEYPSIPAGEAIVLSPLANAKFEPEVILVYGNTAQIMMLTCGLQKERYERFWFSFIGEGACSDSLGQCYVTGKPALSMPCAGERYFGQVSDDEMIIALPPSELERAVSGLRKLRRKGLQYPINSAGAYLNPLPALTQLYPDLLKPKQR